MALSSQKQFSVLGFRFLAFSRQLTAYKKEIAWEWKFGG
jgi:hypothetical protein